MAHLTGNSHNTTNDELNNLFYESGSQLNMKELFGDVASEERKTDNPTERRNVILWSEYLADYRDMCVDALAKYLRFDEIYSLTGTDYDSVSNTLLFPKRGPLTLRGKTKAAVYFYFALLGQPPQGCSPLVVSQDGGSLVVDDNIESDFGDHLSSQALRLRDAIVTYFLKILQVPFREIRMLPRNAFLETGSYVNRIVRLSCQKEVLIPPEISVLLNLYEREVEANALTFWDYLESEAPYFLAEDGKWLTGDDYDG